MTEEGHIKVHSLDLFENDTTYIVNRSMYKLSQDIDSTTTIHTVVS